MPLAQLMVDCIRAVREDVPESGATILQGRVIRQAERAAESSAPVLIDGEAGSGAWALAQAIHACSVRKDGPFIRYHAGAGSGHASMSSKSYPSPALATRILEARGGTCLIQDVEKLAPDEQATLLRIVQDRGIDGAGTRRALRADIRIIATSHIGLIERVRAGQFREDLYYRLHILPITLPPLRSQRNSIIELARFFMARFMVEEGKRLLGLSPEAEALLTRYDWPGNIRQLENAIFRAVILADGLLLTPAEFPQIAAQMRGYRIDIPPAPALRASDPLRDIGAGIADPHALKLMNDSGEMRTMGEIEAEIIRFALGHYRGHMSAISRHLGIGRSTLYRKLKEIGLETGISDAAA